MEVSLCVEGRIFQNPPPGGCFHPILFQNISIFHSFSEKKIATSCNYFSTAVYNLLSDNRLCTIQRKIKKNIEKENWNEKKCIFAS
jgi:hypothetical protein